jgi:hypothetical protein
MKLTPTRGTARCRPVGSDADENDGDTNGCALGHKVTYMGLRSMTVNNVKDTLIGSSSSEERRSCLRSVVDDPDSNTCHVAWFHDLIAAQNSSHYETVIYGNYE